MFFLPCSEKRPPFITVRLPSPVITSSAPAALRGVTGLTCLRYLHSLVTVTSYCPAMRVVLLLTPMLPLLAKTSSSSTSLQPSQCNPTLPPSTFTLPLPLGFIIILSTIVQGYVGISAACAEARWAGHSFLCMMMCEHARDSPICFHGLTRRGLCLILLLKNNVAIHRDCVIKLEPEMQCSAASLLGSATRRLIT